MKLFLISVGHRPPAWIVAGFEDYARRMPRELPIVLLEVKPGRRDGDSLARNARARADEAKRIVAAVPNGSVKIALDEHGRTLTTVQLAQQLEDWMRQGRDICFIIGGADGLDDRIKRESDLLMSLSALTMPHGLVRVVLAEQLYRALMLTRNHPYHKQ